MKPIRFLLIAVICILAGGRGIALGQCVPPPSGMVAWWSLDETAGTTAPDVAGSVNNSGTWMNSPTPVNGKVADALSFSGSNSVDVPDQAELNFGTGDFSIDLWIQTTASSGTHPILDKRTGSVPNLTGYNLCLWNGKPSMQLADGAGYTILSSTGLVADGNWHHVAVTVDRDNTSGLLFYVDGSLVSTLNPTGRQLTLTNTAPFVMARNLISPSETFAGTLDELELFNRVLDPAEVLSIFQADSAGKCKYVMPPSSMVHWWSLDEQVGATVVKDIVGGYDGTPSPGGQIGNLDPALGPTPASLWPPADGGKVGDALYFWTQQDNRFVRVPDHADLQFGLTDFSIDAWVFINQYSGTDIQPIVEKMQYNGTTPDLGYRFYLESGVLSFTLAWGSGQRCTFTTAPSQISQGVWHHVAVTVDRDSVSGATTKLYVDGTVLNWGTCFLFNDSIANTEDLIIGGSLLGPAINYLDIAVDEVGLYDTVLTDHEVFLIYQAGAHGKSPQGWISGTKFWDHERDGIQQGNDRGIANWTIFIDGPPFNGHYDPGEKCTTTDAQGHYSILYLAPMNWYRICEVNQLGWAQTLPPATTPYYDQWVHDWDGEPGLDFGNWRCDSCSNNFYDNVVENWSFIDGTVAGRMPSGRTDNWTLAYESPDVMVGKGWCDSDYVGMWGNQVVGEAIQQTLASPFDPNFSYIIKFQAKWASGYYPLQFEFRASTVPLVSPQCSGPTCVVIGVSAPLTPQGQWTQMRINDWTPPTGTQYSNLTVSATNQSSFDNGDSTSYGAIDWICILPFKPGDWNVDGKRTVSDVVYGVNYLFRGGPAPVPLEAGDVNCDGKMTVSDVVYLINYLFKGGPPPGC